MSEELQAVEYRGAAVADVNQSQRLIEVIAAPYDQEGVAEFRGQVWHETFARGAFDGIERRPNRVRVNREHDESRTFGKVVSFHPNRPEGLVADVKVAETLLGDEVLALVTEDMLSASVAFMVRGSDQDLDRVNRHRRVRRAFLRHLSFVEVPAYEGAKVLSVRSDGSTVDAATLPPLVTPKLDELLAFQRATAARLAERRASRI